MTPEEYLEIERKAEFKSEYYNGEMFAMAGTTINHGRLATDLTIILGQQLQGRGCHIHGSDIRVRVRSADLYTYPDLSVVCGTDEIEEENLLNPTLIVEVLSPSTEAYDRGRKFEYYRCIESLREYLLIAQDRMQVDLFTKQADERWLLTSASKPEETVELHSIGCQVPLATLYARVTLEPAAAPS